MQTKLALLVLAGLATTAAADTDDRLTHRNDSSPAEATLWAVGGTAAGLGLVAAGFGVSRSHHTLGLGIGAAGLTTLLVAPSFGHLYTGEYQHALTMSLVRIGVVAGTTAIGLGIAFGSSCTELCQGKGGIVLVSAGVGLAVATGLAVYDIFDAHRSAERRNRMALAPMATEHGFGLALVGRL